METASLQLPKDLIEGAIKQHIQAAMAAALGDRAMILERAVTQVLTMKVNSEGKPGGGYGSDIEFIQWAVRDAMTSQVRAVLSEEIAKHKDRIRAQLLAELQKKNSPLVKHLVESMATGMIDVTNKYRMSVVFNPA